MYIFPLHIEQHSSELSLMYFYHLSGSCGLHTVAGYSSFGRTKPRYTLSLSWIDGVLRLHFNKASVRLALEVINWICLCHFKSL